MKRAALVFEKCFENLPYTSLQVVFFLMPRIHMHTEFGVILFGRAENHLCGRLKGDCCLKSLKEKQIILYSQHLPKKL